MGQMGGMSDRSDGRNGKYGLAIDQCMSDKSESCFARSFGNTGLEPRCVLSVTESLGHSVRKPFTTYFSQLTLFCRMLQSLRSAGVGNDIADIVHAGAELDKALKTQPEAGVGHTAIAAQIQVFRIVFRIKVVGTHCVNQLI